MLRCLPEQFRAPDMGEFRGFEENPSASPVASAPDWTLH
jgi:hypothetical protein